jgi:hypothetical protein
LNPELITLLVALSACVKNWHICYEWEQMLFKSGNFSYKDYIVRKIMSCVLMYAKHEVGLRHHCMAHLWVVGGGMASRYEGYLQIQYIA